MHDRTSPLILIVIVQIALASLAAYFSQLLIFDETDWYRIDRYDVLVWGVVVTQVFGLAIHVSKSRISTVAQSLSVFYCLAGLAAGLTLAATLFLVIEAIFHKQEVLSLLAIAPGYWIAVFIFFVSMFLHIRLAIICLEPISRLIPMVREVPASDHDHNASEPNAISRFSMIDIFAFTGLAAVSISSYRLVMGIMNGYDPLRFLAMFYAASAIAFAVYAVVKSPRKLMNVSLFLLGLYIVVLSYAEFWIAERLQTRFHRIGIYGTTMPIIVAQILLWNAFVAVATWLQLRVIESGSLRLLPKR